METKLWIALCALLVNSGSVYCEGSVDANGLAAVPPKDGLSLNITRQEQANSSNTRSFSSNSTQGSETISGAPNSTNDNGTDTSSAPLFGLDKNQTSSPAPDSSNSSISNTTSPSTISNRKNATTISPPSNHTILNHNNTTTLSNQSTPTGTFSPRDVPVNMSTAATAPTIPTPKPSSSPKAPSIHPPADTSQSSTHPETSTTSSPNITSSTQTKVHSESSSHLNVGGSTAENNDSPAFDPLMAGLVSAFVITAIIITLLLFLKLRQRQNGPAFHRLQEVPMDDMEETPLYSY
uniref:Mucin 12, cell surface associated n=1 Tax=Nothobranchius rachovii TaxID=451742 RepID=A0A1A8P0K7_9TELE